MAGFHNQFAEKQIRCLQYIEEGSGVGLSSRSGYAEHLVAMLLMFLQM